MVAIIRLTEDGYPRNSQRAVVGIQTGCGVKEASYGWRAAIEAAGARLLYLPPYSPDLAPGSQHRPPTSVRSGATIEHAFAKLKALFRTAAARSVDVLWETIGQLFTAFSSAECARYLVGAGYVPSNRETVVVGGERGDQGDRHDYESVNADQRRYMCTQHWLARGKSWEPSV